MRHVILATVLILMTLGPVRADDGSPAKVGDLVEVWGHCKTEIAAGRLAALIIEKDDEGYARVMRDPRVPCFDVRFHGPTQAEGGTGPTAGETLHGRA